MPARRPILANRAWKAFGVMGPPRSDENTCGDVSDSRCMRRRARISSPRRGWTLGEPFLALRTCSRPAASSILLPLQITQLASSKSMTIADHDHRRIAMSPSGCPSGPPSSSGRSRRPSGIPEFELANFRLLASCWR